MLNIGVKNVCGNVASHILEPLIRVSINSFGAAAAEQTNDDDDDDDDSPPGS